MKISDFRKLKIKGLRSKIYKSPDYRGITPSKNMWDESISIAEYRKLVKKKPKYGNETAVKEGKGFDSRKEARRYQELKLLEKAGEIRDIDCQTPLAIEIKGVLICRYIADFSYRTRDGKAVFEDVKSPATRKLALYRLKKKLVKVCLGVEITEV